MSAGWFELRFTEDSRKVRLSCRHCGRSYWLPPSKAPLYVSCGGECTKAWRLAEREARARPCATCGKTFVPRPGQLAMGAGKYCSQRCNPSHKILNAEEVQRRAVASRAAALAAGLFSIPTGPDHPSWRGGPEVCQRRRVESGISAERVRKYRAKYPEKVREFSHRRKGKKLGRLPRGTVKRIGELQRWRCAICRLDIKRSFHIDHVMPLAKGGTHEPSNIQLLCGPCNVRKSDKHPVDYMQQRGFLL